jgi:DNA-binding winged helix-turn-helix (wHTH) protein/Flp pilus assembly protein TadD
MTTHRFGRFRFELPARELFLDGEPVALQRRTAELLELLVERAPALAPRDEIFARLWPAGFVEDGNLFQHVYTLRRALAVDPAVRVETVRGRGYRLAFTAAELPATVAPSTRIRRGAWFAPRRRFAARAAALAVALTLLAGAVPAPRGEAVVLPSALAEPAATAYRLGIYAFQRRTPSGFVRAHAYFGRTVALAPRAPDGYAGLALLAATSASVGAADRSRAYALAERRARRALALGESATAHAVLGFVALRRDDAPQRALEELERAVLIEPENATAHEWRGVALLYAGRLADATTSFRAAVRLDPSSSANLYWLGLAELYAGRFADARWTLEQSRTLDGRSFERLEALVAEQTSAELAGDVVAAARILARAQREGVDRCFVRTARIRLHVAAGGSEPSSSRATCSGSRYDALATAVTLVALRRDGDALRAVREAMRADPWSTRLGLLYDPRLRGLRGELAPVTG